jgi:sulfate transport system permease protein
MKIKPLPTTESVWMKLILISITIGFIALLILFPLFAIFTQALSKGINAYLAALFNPETIDAILLTLFVTIIVIPLNVSFGLAAGWAIGKFHFPGKQILISLIDLPLSVSPVIAGLIYVLLFSIDTPLGKWLASLNIQIIFAVPGIIIATLFVTFPYAARELIPLMQQLGNDEEEAAQLLGAKGLSTFWRITLPNIKWGLMYGTLICAARAVGEFGAVSVVSGHIQGKTNTLPLQVEILYNEYNFTAAFAVSSILTFLALITLMLRVLIDFHLKNKSK